MNLINWSDEWSLLLETIKRQDFEHVLEKSNRHDLRLTMKGIAITSLATGMGALIGGLAYGPLGAVAGSTTASMISYGTNIKYKSLYELIKQLTSEEKCQLLINIKAVLGGIFNEQTIILGAVGPKPQPKSILNNISNCLVVAKEIYKYINEMKRTLNDTNYVSTSNNFMIIEDFNE